MSDPILFASDIHLSDADQQTVDAFVDFLHRIVPAAQSLYLLGDLFEYWAGDDDDNQLAQWIAAELRTAADSGVKIHLMHGNRDFLIGVEFAQRSHIALLPELHLLDAFGTRLLLCHGDTLCTDDVGYQQFRTIVRQPDWQAQFLAQPLPKRLAEVARLRSASKQATQTKASDIMDVNPAAVSALLAQHPGTHLIHGHTHRPHHHQHAVQHTLRNRWVLPDWYQGTGGYLILDSAGIRLQELTLAQT